MSKGIKFELLGIGAILLGIAAGIGDVIAIVLGIVGFGLVSAGCFLKEK